MTALVCSLISKTPQSIPPDEWTLLRFPEESGDDQNWHRPGSPFIVPNRSGQGILWAMVRWMPGVDVAYLPTTAPPWPAAPAVAFPQVDPPVARVARGERMAQFARNADLPALIDTTGTDERPASVGRTFSTMSWVGWIRAGTTYSVRVTHNDSKPVAVELAELKLHLYDPA